MMAELEREQEKEEKEEAKRLSRTFPSKLAPVSCAFDSAGCLSVWVVQRMIA